MKPEGFIEGLKRLVVEDNFSIYQNLLETTKKATDPTWFGILPIYNGLSQAQKSSFLNFIKLIEVDTVSNILGIIDGSSYFNGEKEGFKLTFGSDNVAINGNLQNIFLAMMEN